MNTPTTLAAYAAALAVVLAASAGVGKAVGPVGETPDAAPHAAHQDAAPAAAPAADGLAVSRDGYSLVLDAAPRTAGRTAPLAFRVLGPGGAPVTDYEVQHERELHLVVVRRDGTGFQHLHPRRDAGGTWSTPLLLPAAGSWKVFADVVPVGADEGVVLATDLTVPGAVQTTVLPAEQRSTAVDGYEVTVEGDLAPGRDSRLVFRVSRDGRPVSDLEPYLGADGHLVALRDGDLAYLHVHPETDAGAPGEVVFTAEVPSAGDYRLFLDFQHQGVVRTAALGLRAPQQEQGAPATGTHDTDADADAHDDTHDDTHGEDHAG